MNISKIDLNLLPVFDALMRERNVTRAGHRLFLSQPAVSHALQRLRNALDDPLFVRNGRDMIPTPRALALEEAARPLLERLAEVLQGQVFSAASIDQTFRFAMPDIAEFVVVPRLLPLLSAEAPKAGLALHDLNLDEFQSRLAKGELDVALITDVPLRPGMHRRPLVREEKLVGLVRRDHPITRRTLTPEMLRKLPRLAVTLSGGRVISPIEQSPLAASSFGEVLVSTPHFTSTAAALMHSDLIFIIGELAGQTIADLFALRVVQLPVSTPAVESSLVWHERTHRDPAHRWFREAVARSLDQVINDYPPRPAASKAAARRK